MQLRRRIPSLPRKRESIFVAPTPDFRIDNGGAEQALRNPANW